MKKQTNCHYNINYHIILTVKYRKQLMLQYDQFIKDVVNEVTTTANFEIKKIESDKDHLHILISARPDISVSHIIRRIKQQTTYELWKKHPVEMKKEFWKSHIFWSPSYFVATVGSVSLEAIEKYINDQRNPSRKLKQTGLIAR